MPKEIKEIELIADKQKTLDLGKQLVTKKLILRPSVLSNMATPQDQSPSFSITNKSEIFLLVQALPEYHPGQNLSLFINEVDNLVNHLKDRLTVDLVHILN